MTNDILEVDANILTAHSLQLQSGCRKKWQDNATDVTFCIFSREIWARCAYSACGEWLK